MIFMAGCAGREAQPVKIYQRGDETSSCDELKRHASVHEQMGVKKKEIKNKQTWNVVWVITGVFVIFPFFFMDLKGAEEAELEALKQRYEHLWEIARDNECEWALEATAAAELGR
jgi:hypothetical protein